MSQSLLISGASLVGRRTCDVLIDDGHIVEIGSISARPGVQTLDAAGLILLPGLVDLHTHLREPGKEDAETIATGAAAAAVGGYTAVFAMANTTPVTDTAERAEWISRVAREVDVVDVHPIGAITRDLAGSELADIAGMAASAARVRVFSDDGKCVQDAGLMRRALEEVSAVGGVISQHSQDFSLADSTACFHEGDLSREHGLTGWPDAAEEVIVARDVLLAQQTGARVHVAHVTTPGALDIVRWAKARGIAVTAEVTPHHLLLTTDLVASGDPVYKVNPPLRPDAYAMALREGLADGTIDIVATDHAPHPAADKQRSFADAAFGMLGLETALGVVATVMVETGLMDWAAVARVMSERPATIGGLADQGRPLAVGELANLVLVDPGASVTVDREQSLSKSRNNPYHGRALSAQVQATIRRGRLVAQAGALTL